MTSNRIKKLNRFTSLPILLDLLQRKKLTLLNPRLWEDKNDIEVICEYQRRKSIKNLFALCFSHDDETVHHWKTFSHGTSGCCIEFDAIKLFNILNKISGLRHGKVNYKKISQITKSSVSTDKIPFTKRWPYRCEAEYRLIMETDKVGDFYEIEIPLNIINKITISQQMPKQIYNTIKKYLRSIKGDPESRINRSTLYENKIWINGFKAKKIR